MQIELPATNSLPAIEFISKYSLTPIRLSRSELIFTLLQIEVISCICMLNDNVDKRSTAKKNVASAHPSATVEVKVAKNIKRAAERVLKWNPSQISFQYCGNRRLERVSIVNCC